MKKHSRQHTPAVAIEHWWSFWFNNNWQTGQSSEPCTRFSTTTCPCLSMVLRECKDGDPDLTNWPCCTGVFRVACIGVDRSEALCCVWWTGVDGVLPCREDWSRCRGTAGGVPLDIPTLFRAARSSHTPSSSFITCSSFSSPGCCVAVRGVIGRDWWRSAYEWTTDSAKWSCKWTNGRTDRTIDKSLESML